MRERRDGESEREGGREGGRGRGVMVRERGKEGEEGEREGGSERVREGGFTSAAPTRDLSTDDLSLLNVLHSDPTSITLHREQIYAQAHTI